MRTRSLVLLLVLMIVAAVGTVAQDVRFGKSEAAERTAAETLHRDVESALLTLADLRTAQAAYVATGQGPAFWMTRASDLLGSAASDIAGLKSLSSSPEAIAHYDAAQSALVDLQKVDGRARSFVKNDQRFLASDAVFMDGLGVSKRATDELADAREVERGASAARIDRIERLRLAMNAGCLFVAILVSTLLLRATLVWMSPAAEATAAPIGLEKLAGQPAAPTPAATPGVNLADAAELCLDLARVLDARDVGALFDRAALVLDAKGLVLWSVDTSGAILRPTLTHGYTERVVARMNGLQVDSDTATALAFRSMQTQTVPGQTSGAPGALAVPLITASGCVGVLAAETLRSVPGRDTVAVAKMFAAQLSALVAPGGEAAAAAAQ